MTAHFPGRAAIEGYGRGGFSFAGMSHRGSILVLPSGIYAWNVDPARMSVDDFVLVLAERAAIDLLVIGMGAAMARPPKTVREALAGARIMVDSMATGHAIATYNLLLEEHRKVAAALIAVAYWE